jgi:hypothetical protein
MKVELKRQLELNFWKELSSLFTEEPDEKYMEFFFQLQDVFDIKSDDESKYCKEMVEWSKERQQEFLNSCLDGTDKNMKDEVLKLLEKFKVD